MTPEQRQGISAHLAAFDFSGLFTSSSLGWDWPAGRGRLRVPHGSAFLELDTVAEKRGVKILHCPPDSNGRIPLSEDRRKIEKAVTPIASEHLLIFTDAAKTRQIWQWPAKRPGKPSSLRELTWEKGKSNELLFQKLASIAFTLDEEDGLDITGVVRKLADTLDRDRVTKKFYDLFKKQKDAFQKFIKGLSDTGLQAWYTSLMLNRIMFCYFLQRKGFLDGDPNYLANRLGRVQDQIGKNKFHSFYRSFLRRLFHEGLGSQERSQELIALIGTIPYLNGGIFDEHPIERGNPDLSIPDEAFEMVFKFFDQFDWHLDDRPIGNDNEINPEILGYVFEKYTNQKEMGAYYTKEDITEYISKNCIIPFLIHTIADKLPATAWQLLPADPYRYIYEAVRRGAGSTVEEWTKSLPKNIAIGLDTTKPGLIKRRKDWNTTTPPSHSLPTEIWRETLSRHQRCHELRAKLRAGEVKAIDDFVTLNLDIRQFAQDVIESADASLLLAFFERLKKLSVLDPTCGSGAFLFAALEILEPLYTACIQRFRAILADWQSSGEKHPNWEKEIRAILDHAAAHPNEGYYIHKTIIVHNLYGVDIMEEAVEICKLRLFLKLAAQLQPGQQVEPLPDIDFNIRYGNTLVGYASRDAIRNAVENDESVTKQIDGLEQGMLVGTVTDSKAFTEIMDQAEDADRAFQRFHQLQEATTMQAAEFRSAKKNLQRTLEAMRDKLDGFLASGYDKKHLKTDASFAKWRKSHQPFHWFIEFYGIMNKGGFDVIVGNPPYVEYREVISTYTVSGYETLPCGDLYAFTMERACAVIRPHGQIGLIVPISVSSTDGFASLQSLLRSKLANLSLSCYSNRPSQIFEGAQKRLALVMGSKAAPTASMLCSRYIRFGRNERAHLMETMHLVKNLKPCAVLPCSIEKIGSLLEAQAFSRLSGIPRTLELSTSDAGRKVFYTRKFGYFLDFLTRAPKMKSLRDGSAGQPSELKTLGFGNEAHQYAAIAALSSSTFFWFWNVLSDCRNLNRRDVMVFPLCLSDMEPKLLAQLSEIGKRYIKMLYASSSWMQKSGWSIETFDFGECKPIIDEIDTVLAKHYGFTDEELDFILNYDIKYRLGLGRDGGADDEEAIED